tara:strand:+ start:213 stop:422 length:210 start_codon:yes stop_codon:yes gene_type:complete
MSNIEFEWIDETDGEVLSIDCPVCKILISTIEDVMSLKEKGCCEECELTYYYPNKEKWDKGWRPDIVRD